MLSAIKDGAADVARRSALGLAGVLLAGVGLGFMTAAAWQGLALWNGPIAASLIVGAFYLGIGMILLALARRPEPVPPPAAQTGDGQMLRVVDAFFEGVEAGVRSRRGAPDRGAA